MLSRVSLLVLLLVLSVGQGFGADEELTLSVNVSGAEPGIGSAIFSLFTQKGYLRKPVMNKTVPVDQDGQARWEIKSLAAGTYAVSVIYDENKDGKLNTGLFGIPKEKIAMSNNAKGRFGPPSFKKSSFIFSMSKEIDLIFTGVR